MSIQISRRKIDTVAMLIMAGAVIGFLVGFGVSLFTQ
jgi:flagellar biosynthesis protein FliQ